MNWDRSSKENSSGSSGTPLISIGCTVLAVIMVPIVLYSLGPAGPLKVGDVVFATDRHRVSMIDTNVDGPRKQLSVCLLEPRVQLVVKEIGIPPGGLMIAEPISFEKATPPFCPPRRPVLVHPHYVTLQANLWGGLRDTLSHFFSGR